MSHRLDINWDGFEVRVFHNSDWSDDAEVRVCDTYTGVAVFAYEIPGTLLLALGKEIARKQFKTDLISWAEDYE